MKSDFNLGIKKTLSILNEMQSEKIIGRYAIGGAIAAFIYVEPAFTADIDIFVIMDGASLDPLGPINDWLKGRGYDKYVREGLLIEGWAVQFIPASNPLEKDALARAIPVDLEGVQTWIFSQEHLMALCLELGRPKDHARLASFLLGKTYDEKLFMEIINRFDLAKKWTMFKSQMTDL